MSKDKNISPAQMIDSFLRRIGLGVAVVAVMYGTGALEAVLPGDYADYADGARFALSALVILLVFPSFAKFMLARKRGVCKGADADSYMAQMFKEAAHHAFSATFIALIAVEFLVKALAPDLPTLFFIDLTLFISLSAFSIAFFKLTAADDEEEDDWEQEDKDAGDE
ncbi:hypothetical protein [Kordiimonas aestuarii]|uniref:hypothetical protein n=1 Tax=Kordiimonas aestuarii TaxID=1005925 RepID=UPI0021D17040|nr:hypothetical protein [Kordiimonas aestuarii]